MHQRTLEMMFTNDCWQAYYFLKNITQEAMAAIVSLDADEESKYFPLRHLQLVLFYLISYGLDGLGRSLALMWGFTKSATGNIADILRPVEEQLRNAVLRCAHESVMVLAYTDARATLLHFVEAQLGSPLTNVMQSRLLHSYHKLYGSLADGALFDSNTSILKAKRNGWTRRPRSMRNTVADSADTAPAEAQESEEVPQVPADPAHAEASSTATRSSSAASRWLDMLD